MNLIIGGAYQGKLEHAQKTYNLKEDDIFNCSPELGDIDFSKKCINRLEEYTWYCTNHNIDSVAEFEAHASKWENSILICGDISSGVVPMGADNRAWREQNGRLCAYLSRKAVTVTRMFCGISQVLK